MRKISSKTADDIWFFAPSIKRFNTSEFSQSCDCFFRPVSITGASCKLMCDHCGASILKGMEAATAPRELMAAAARLHGAGARGMLVSGGSDKKGVVPLEGFLNCIAAIKSRFDLKIIVHTGLTSPDLAQGLAAAGVDAAMIDIIGADESIAEVCHLPGVSSADYDQSLANLVSAGVPVAPHVVIGLHNGEIRGESEALAIISRHRVDAAVMVGLTPRPGTAMEAVVPPSPEAMGAVFAEARELMPDTPLLLGCERPWGLHKEKTDALALKAGFDGIAYPAEGTIAAAEGLGKRARRSEMCCALMFQETGEPNR